MANQLLSSRGRQSLGRLAVLWLVAVTAALRQCHFDLEAAGMLPASPPSQALQGVSGLALCVTACLNRLGLRCLSLAYSQEQRECRVYSVFDPSDVTVTSPGHKYYRGCPDGSPDEGGLQDGDVSTSPPTQGPPASAVGKPCSGTHTECTSLTANTECRDGKCQCVIGYHYNPGPGTCVERCSSYGTGFYTGLGCVSNNNLYSITMTPNADHASCGAACLKDPDCRTYEIQDTWCHLAGVTRLDFPSQWGPWCQFGMRDCA